MKLIRKTLTLLPEDVDYAEKRSREGGEPANISKYVRDLIRRDKEEAGTAKRKKAA